MQRTAIFLALFLTSFAAGACSLSPSGSPQPAPPPESVSAVLTGVNASGVLETPTISLWNLSDDCRLVGVSAQVESGTDVRILGNRSDCTPKMYYVEAYYNGKR